MTTSPRLVYTPSPGTTPAFPTGSEVTFRESSFAEMDGIHAHRIRPIVACDTPRGVQLIRVADLSVEVA